MSTKQSTSYGIIPLVQSHGEWRCFLIQHRKNNFWGFPKGHAEEGEAPVRAAERELCEETGLAIIRMLDKTPLIERYVYSEGGTPVEKTVYFYLALTSQEATVDPAEILTGRWCSFDTAREIISYPEGQQLLQQILQRLQTLTDLI